MCIRDRARQMPPDQLLPRVLEQMVDTTPAGPSHLVTGQNLYYQTPLTILNSSGATIRCV